MVMMECYVFQADLFCKRCGERIKHERLKPEHVDESNESSYDSGEWPKGPYPVGEADYPCHCGGCGRFLKNPLTRDGVRYVVEAAREADFHPDRTFLYDSPVLHLWYDYYKDDYPEIESLGSS